MIRVRLKDIELWAWIPGYRGRYMASTWGRFRSFTRRGGGRLMRLPVHPRTGYVCVGLVLKRKGPGRLKCEYYSAHVLVLYTFVGPCPDLLLYEGSHLDGVRTNNRLDNLAWETLSQNQLRRRQHGTARRGAENYLAKFGNKEARLILFKAFKGGSLHALAKRFRVSWQTIKNIVSGRTWGYLQGL